MKEEAEPSAPVIFKMKLGYSFVDTGDSIFEGEMGRKVTEDQLT